ncbi:MAG: DUF6270 domain-containing protein [Nocardioides sp.]|nr:DUF6270 domain-containing protein [Nocardioides sp.]
MLGSCATRDNFNRRFNPTYRESFECPLAQNQTSIISLMSPPVLDDWSPTGEMSDYDRWNVRTDLTRSFLEDLADLQPDYVIVDFFADIHFGVVRLPDGRYVTDNRWKVKHTDWYQEKTASGSFDRITLFGHTEDYLELWKDAFDRFVAFVRRRTPRTRVIVHRGYNTNLVRIPERPVPMRLRKRRPNISKLDVARANNLWGILDDYAVAVADAAVIDLTDEEWTTYEDHPWGPFYVHFPPEYNHRFLAELHKIVLADRLPGWLVQRIDEIETPRVERARLEAESAERLITHLRGQLQAVRTSVAPAATLPRSRVRGAVKRVLSRLRHRVTGRR